MKKKLISEYTHFLTYPRPMRVLLITNLIYAFVLPVIDIFVAAYIMRNSNDVTKVITYQLMIYSGIPLTFLINGYLLRKIKISYLYSLGMILSAVSLAVMMSLNNLDIYGIGSAGLIMGMSFGFFWANRDFLALDTTTDENRNYYYGLETFFYTSIYVIIPIAIGWFLELSKEIDWLGNSINNGYKVITGIVFGLTILASIIVQKGQFNNPPKTKFIYFKFHKLWNKMQLLAILKGLAQGYIVTAPAMLIMQIVGKEGALGTIQSVGAVLSAIILYIIGRIAKPKHRIYIFSMGLLLFALATIFNSVLFNVNGVLLFLLCLLLAKPLLDIAYFPIQLKVIDIVSKKENRSEYSYILNHEYGLYVGRLIGCMTFILLAFYVSDNFSLRYALLIIGLLQLTSIWIAKSITKYKV